MHEAEQTRQTISETVKNWLNVNTLFRHSPAIFPAYEHFKTECVLFGMISICKVGTIKLKHYSIGRIYFLRKQNNNNNKKKELTSSVFILILNSRSPDAISTSELSFG